MGEVATYLARWAEPAAALAPSLTRNYAYSVVIPSCGEQDLLPDCIRSLAVAAPAGGVLAILVLNEGRHALSAYLNSNRLTREHWKVPNGTSGYWVAASERLHLLFVDAGILRGGVGEARKLGCDLALRYWHQDRIESPWISTTDGDARVDAEYFAIAPLEPTTGLGEQVVGLWRDYAHQLGGPSDPALAWYECFLRYHELGLASAGSPYAYPALGSTLAIEATAYARVRGFPKREAGEDFYMLDKLAKIGKIARAPGCLSLIDRPSQRVPFGTGASTTTIERTLAESGSYLWYDPRTYRLLRSWLEAWDRIAEHRRLDRWQAEIESHPGLIDFSKTRDFAVRIEQAIRSRKTVVSLRRHLHTDFDGLETLKLCHWVRDHVYPAIPWEQALKQAEFISHVSGAQSDSPNANLHAQTRARWGVAARRSPRIPGAICGSPRPAPATPLRLG